MAENYDSAVDQLRAHGLVVEALDTSGRIVRVDCEDRPGKKHGWYIAHEFLLDGRTYIVGRYGDWRADDSGHPIDWKPVGEDGKPRTLSDAERSALRQRRAEQRQAAETARAELAGEAATRAERIWSSLPDSGTSEYLKRKGVRAFGLRFSRGAVVVPLRNAGGALVGLQFVDGDGTKRFLTGTAKKGAWHWVGDPATEDVPLAIAEGYATAATVHQVMGWPVAVCFDAGNLRPVFEAIRAVHPRRRIVVCGDDDHESPKNTGREKATALAERYASPLALPRFADGADRSDWNDLLVAEGGETVRAQLEACLEALPPSSPSASAVDFSLGILLEYFTVIHGTNLVYDGRRGRLMALANLGHSAGKGLVRRWLEHDDRRTVNEEDVVFDPAMVETGRPRVNLFTGMELQPDGDASCELMVQHLYKLCSERERLFDWVLKWVAYPLQHPGTKMSTAIVMYGSEGTGKNLFWETVLAIYGRWGVMVGQAEIESQFNGWLSAKLFAVADEVVSRQELRHLKGKLKQLVTGQRVMINEKNQPVREERNAMNIVFLSNEDEPLRIDPGDRRYCAVRFDVREDEKYFKALGAEVAAGGAAALYRYLLNYDLEDFTPWTLPYETDERDALMQVAASPALRFWNDWRDDELPLPYVSCRCQDLYQAFRAWCSLSGERFVPNDTLFGTSLRPFEGQWFRKDRPRIVAENGAQRRPKCYVLLDSEGGPATSKPQDDVDQFRTAVDDYVKAARNAKL